METSYEKRSEIVPSYSETESYSVVWYVYTGWSERTKRQAKVFLHKEDAKAFKKDLESAAKFVGCFIEIEIEKN